MTDEILTGELPVPGPLQGERVVVRPFADDDAPGMYEGIIESLAALRPWMPWPDSYHSVDDVREYILECSSRFLLRTDFPLGMFRRADGRFLGGTGFHIGDAHVPSFEIGYWVRSSEEGRGYVSEAVRLVTACAFETMGAQRVTIRCDARNVRSRRVAERQGYRFEGTQRNFGRDPAGQLFDMLVFSMIPADFAAAREHWPKTSE